MSDLFIILSKRITKSASCQTIHRYLKYFAKNEKNNVGSLIVFIYLMAKEKHI